MNLKKIISLLVAVMMLGALLAACDKGGTQPTPAPTQAGGSEATPVPTEPTEPGEEIDPTTLRLQLASEPDRLDPALNSSVDGACLAAASFGGLYTYDAEGELVPNFAESYTMSEDGLTYVFTMKEGLKWSDGSDLTAADFEYSWKRAANPQTGADYAYMLSGIAGYGDIGTYETVVNDAGEEEQKLVSVDPDKLQVKAEGNTLTVTLAAPCAYMLDLMAFPTFYAVKQSQVEAAAGFKDAEGNIIDAGAWALEAGFVSSGPFMLESWTHNESMVYVKNPNYWDAANVTLEKLEFMLSADDVAIYAAYRAGDLDFIDTVPNDEIQTLLSTNDPEFYTVSELGTYYVCFNVNSPLYEGKTPEQASAMRRAFGMLVDREYIVETVGQTGQVPATSFIPVGMLDGNGGVFHDSNDTGYGGTTPDVEGAIALLESAGYVFENGMLSSSTPISFEYIINESTGHVAIAECIQQDLLAVGINMSIKTLDWDTLLAERKAGNFDVSRNGWIADFNDPINMLEMWITDSGNNDAQFGRNAGGANPDWTEYNSLIAQIKSTTDFAARVELMHQAEDILMASGAILPIYHYNDSYMMKPYMQGFYSNAFGTKFFQYVTKG